MGGKSSSSSSSSNTTQTQNLHLQDLEGVTVAGSDNVSLSLSDHDAIAAGRDVAMQALDGVVEQSRGLFDFLQSREQQAISTIAGHSADALAGVVDVARQSGQTDSQQALETAVKLGGVAVVVMGAAWALKR